MAVPSVSENFADLLDPRFQRIFNEHLAQLPEMWPSLYMVPEGNGRDQMSWSDVGAFGDWGQFNGSISYDDVTQGFDTVSIPLQFASGFMVERELFDDDQYNIMDQRPRGLATAYNRTREKHGARMFNNAFSSDSFFYQNSENVALCSDSHLTNAAGVSTASGFDNLTVSALSATALAAARIQMVDFRDDRANRTSIVPDSLLYPHDLYEIAFEIVSSMGKVDTADNNRNVHEGRYTLIEWNYLTDANNWFLMDSALRAQMLFWVNRIAVEFAFVEDFDTLVAKWRGYSRYSNAWINWRWILGANVT